MYRTYNDLRILRLALHMEETFERYEEYLRDLIPEAIIRSKLAGLFQEGSGHRDLRSSYQRLAKKARTQQPMLGTEDILRTLRDCEEWAADFYLRQLDRLSEPRLVELFRRLADEERGHAGLVDQARDLLGDYHATTRATGLRPAP